MAMRRLVILARGARGPRPPAQRPAAFNGWTWRRIGAAKAAAKGRKAARSSEERARGQKTPQVERREAPSSDRKEEGDAFARCLGRLHASRSGSDRKGPVSRRSAPLTYSREHLQDGGPGAENPGGGALASRLFDN
jgi:hypothetical protein